MRNVIGIIMLSIFCALPAHASQPRKIKLYMAAALFNIRETRFNLDLAAQLHQRHYQTILPQQDGFEYKNLAKTAAQFLPKDKVAANVRDLIYFLDMGIFIPQSDIVIANLDEPLDEGVITEITYAHLMGKPVIGYRTDIHTPYGIDQALGGMHAFVAFQCDYLIKHYMSNANTQEADASIASLADKIDATIRMIKLPKDSRLPDYALHNPVIHKLVTSANEIIPHPADIHTDKGINEAVQRLLASKNKIHIAALR